MALDMTWKMLHAHAGNILRHPTFPLVALLYAIHVAEFLLRKYERSIGRIWQHVPFPLRSSVYLAVTLALIYFLQGGKYEFIYFQF